MSCILQTSCIYKKMTEIWQHLSFLGQSERTSLDQNHVNYRRPLTSLRFIPGMSNSASHPHSLQQMHHNFLTPSGQALTTGLHSTLSSIQASPVANNLTTLFLDLTKFRFMVDFNHIISSSFTVSGDNQDTKVVGTIQFKFGAAKAVKQVKTSGDWFIVWGLYMQVASSAPSVT